MDIQELTISVTAQKLNPSLLNLDFLKSSGIVPADWELAQQPVLNPNQARLTFKNGVTLVAQPRNISFLEALNPKKGQQLNAPAIARQYIEKLPYAEYLGASIAPKIIVPQARSDAPREYIVETLLAPGPWRQVGVGATRATISFAYQLERAQLNLSVNEVRLRQSDRQETTPALLFSGSFNYSVAKDTEAERLTRLCGYIDNWSGDLASFREIVYQQFLGQNPPAASNIFPQGAVPSA